MCKLMKRNENKNLPNGHVGKSTGKAMPRGTLGFRIVKVSPLTSLARRSYGHFLRISPHSEWNNLLDWTRRRRVRQKAPSSQPRGSSQEKETSYMARGRSPASPVTSSRWDEADLNTLCYDCLRRQCHRQATTNGSKTRRIVNEYITYAQSTAANTRIRRLWGVPSYAWQGRAAWLQCRSRAAGILRSSSAESFSLTH